MLFSWRAARLEQDLRQRVVEREFGEHFLVGRGRPTASFFFTGRPSFEQDVGELLRRVEVEGLAGEFVRLVLSSSRRRAEFVALLPEQRAVDQDAVALHAPDDLARRHLDLAVDAL